MRNMKTLDDDLARLVVLRLVRAKVTPGQTATIKALYPSIWVDYTSEKTIGITRAAALGWITRRAQVLELTANGYAAAHEPR